MEQECQETQLSIILSRKLAFTVLIPLIAIDKLQKRIIL